MQKGSHRHRGHGLSVSGRRFFAQNFGDCFWKGFDAICEVPPERWDLRRFYDPNFNLAGKMYVKRGGFLQENWSDFDAEFFQISPREAPFLDPQQRLLLELAWEAFEDGGVIPDGLRGSATGVFMGAFTTDWQTLQNSEYNRAHCSIYSELTAPRPFSRRG